VDQALAGGEAQLTSEAYHGPGLVGVEKEEAPLFAAHRPLSVRLKRALPRYGIPAFAIAIILLLYGPLVILSVFSFNDSIVFSLPWSGFTTKWYTAAFADANMRAALINSVTVAAIVAPLSVILGTLSGYAITRLRFKLRGPSAMLLAAPLVVPWLVIGISALIFFDRINFALSWHTVVLMHVVVTFPLVTVLVSARLARFDRTQEEAAIDLGASQLQVLRYVLMPHMIPALAASFILAFSWSFNNFEISYFVGGFDQLFPVWVYSTLRHASNLPIVNAIATLVSAAEVAIVYVAWVAFNWRSSRSSKEKAQALVEVVR
jgi:spermidine/putrescine transport system permease protein